MMSKRKTATARSSMSERVHSHSGEAAPLPQPGSQSLLAGHKLAGFIHWSPVQMMEPFLSYLWSLFLHTVLGNKHLNGWNILFGKEIAWLFPLPLNSIITPASNVAGCNSRGYFRCWYCRLQAHMSHMWAACQSVLGRGGNKITFPGLLSSLEQQGYSWGLCQQALSCFVIALWLAEVALQPPSNKVKKPIWT